MLFQRPLLKERKNLSENYRPKEQVKKFHQLLVVTLVVITEKPEIFQHLLLVRLPLHQFGSVYHLIFFFIGMIRVSVSIPMIGAEYKATFQTTLTMKQVPFHLSHPILGPLSAPCPFELPSIPRADEYQ